jgi:hypothetical protein
MMSWMNSSLDAVEYEIFDSIPLSLDMILRLSPNQLRMDSIEFHN